MTATSSKVRSILNKCNLDDPSQLEDAYPCTSLQAGLLAASIQGTADYTSRFVFRLSCIPFDPDLLKAATEAVFHETPILRTRFIESRGTFLQAVVREKLVWINDDSLDGYIQADKRHTVALGQPVSRFGWITSDDGQVFMVWTLHHAQYDEWTLDLLFARISQNAQAEESGPEAGQNDPVSFKKFVKACQIVDNKDSEEFWAKQLPRSTAVYENWMNSGTQEPVTTKDLVKTFDFRVPAESGHRPALLAVAAWSIVCGIITGSEDVVFGNIVNGRTMDMVGIEGVIGPTITTVPWRVKLQPMCSITEFLSTLSKTQLKMLAYEQNGLAEYLRIAGSTGFDTLLLVQSSPTQSTDTNIPTLRPSDEEGTSPSHACCVLFDIHFGPEACRVKASYDDHRMNEDDMSEIIDLFQSVIGDLSAKPNKTVSEVMTDRQVTRLPKTKDYPSSPLTNDDHGNKETNTEVDEGILKQVTEVITNISGLDVTDITTAQTSLTELGIDSVRTVSLVRKLSEVFKIMIPFKGIAGGKRTVLEIARRVQDAQSGTPDTNSGPVISLLNEAKKHEEALDAIALPQVKSQPADADSKLLLTGANGYLGIEILRQCLTEYKGNVIACVRCSDASSGLSRLESAAKLAKWTSNEISELHRVDVWPGDMANPNLGLSSEHWTILNAAQGQLKLKAIIHNAARVDFLPTYRDLEHVNVTSTTNLLGACLQRDDSPSFVYVTGGRPPPSSDDETLSTTARNLARAPGYSQSKFVGELVVKKAASLGEKGSKPRMTIVHPGLIIGSAATGVASSDDFVWRYVAASILMGVYVPALPTKREWLNVGSVDSIASTIIKSALAGDDIDDGLQTRPVRSGLLVCDFWSIILAELDDEIVMEDVSEQEWLCELEDSIEEHREEHPLFGLSEMIFAGNLKGIGSLCPETLPSAQESEALAEAIRSNVRYLSSTGFFSWKKDSSSQQPMFKRSAF